MSDLIDTVYKREWPKPGQALYSISDAPGQIHLSYVEVPDELDCAILMRIDWQKDVATVLEVLRVRDEKDAVVQYVEKYQKLMAH